jgi:hypothetical protein
MEQVEFIATGFLDKQKKEFSQSLLSRRKSKSPESRQATDYDRTTEMFIDTDFRSPPSCVIQSKRVGLAYKNQGLMSTEELPELASALHVVAGSYRDPKKSGSDPNPLAFGDTISKKDNFDWKYLPRKKSKPEPHESRQPIKLDLIIAPESTQYPTQSAITDRRIVRAMVKKFYKNNQRFGELNTDIRISRQILQPEHNMNIAKASNRVPNYKEANPLPIVPITNPQFNFTGTATKKERVFTKQPIRVEKLSLSQPPTISGGNKASRNTLIWSSSPSTPQSANKDRIQTRNKLSQSATMQPSQLINCSGKPKILVVDSMAKTMNEVIGQIVRSEEKSPSHIGWFGPFENLEYKTGRETSHNNPRPRVEFKKRYLDFENYDGYLSNQGDKLGSNIFRELLQSESLNPGLSKKSPQSAIGERSQLTLGGKASPSVLEARPAELEGVGRPSGRKASMPKQVVFQLGESLSMQTNALTARAKPLEQGSQAEPPLQHSHPKTQTDIRSPEERFVKRYKARNFSRL